MNTNISSQVLDSNNSYRPRRIPWSIRLYSRNDTDKLRSYFNAMSRPNHRLRFQCSMESVHDSILSLYDCDQHPSNLGFVVFSDLHPNQICGEALLACDHAGSQAEIALSVSERYQNQGLGSALVSHLIKTADELGLSTLYADTLRANVKFIALAESLDFVPGNHPDDWRQSRLVLSSCSNSGVPH